MTRRAVVILKWALFNTALFFLFSMILPSWIAVNLSAWITIEAILHESNVSDQQILKRPELWIMRHRA